MILDNVQIAHARIKVLLLCKSAKKIYNVINAIMNGKMKYIQEGKAILRIC